jgi:fibronectin-binding autotransporter adhesin
VTSAAVLILGAISPTQAETWNLPGGGSWNTPASWNPAAVPNAVGANAMFNGGATASNPAQTGNRNITLDGAQTVGSIMFNNDLSTFTNTLAVGTGTTLTFDGIGTGPATITTMGGGTGNSTISAPMVLADSVTAFVNNTAATSAAGSLNLTAAIAGAGGFTKEGDGLMTFGTGLKTYSGATVLNGGRTRISNAAQPSATSSFTINAGAQLTLITSATYNFGSGPLNLNGSGATSGPSAVFPGAIRNDTGLVITIGNQIVLQSNTVVHVQAAAGTGSSATPTGAMTFSNIVSGPGSLSLTAPNSNIDQGTLFLTANNSYAGGTFVNGGIIAVSGASATLGTGDVTVDDVLSPTSIARLMIQSNVLNAIADTAALSLGGGGVLGVADDGFIDLQNGVNETVAALFLDGVAQAPGTYGSSASGAEHIDNEYFSGAGIITVAAAVPEPGSASMLLAGFVALFGRRRFRR